MTDVDPVTGRDLNRIISVVGTIRERENRELDILKATFASGKDDMVRGLIRYALAQPDQLNDWLTLHQDQWRKY